MNELRLLGIHITDRIKEAGLLPKVLSNYSHCIKTRLGFHELTVEVCSRKAYIIIQLTGKPEEWNELENKLNNINGLLVKKMSFNY